MDILSTISFSAIIAAIMRSLFTFGFLMRWGQELLKLKKAKKWNPFVQLVAYVWLLCMFVSAVMDILVNITLMTILFVERPSAINETFSYRIGRYTHNSKYYGTLRWSFAVPICRILSALEGEDHCSYIYGATPNPYPDLKVLF